MNEMRHTLALLFLFSLGVGALPGSAAADPVASDTFKFTWLGIPIGEVTLHYGRYEDPKRAVGLESSALTETPTRTSERQSRGLADGAHEDRGPVQSPRLGSLEGRTNGLVRWLKRYEGAYKSVLTPVGSRYKVTAMDQGAPEVRDIWFGAKHSDIPKVLDFRDRSSADPLQAQTGVDEGSVDPVRLMALILEAIESHNGCPATPEAFRVFDGKRRYEARLSGQNWVDMSGFSAQADTNVALESSFERGLPAAASRTTSTDEMNATESNAAGGSSDRVLDRASQDRKVGDRNLHQTRLPDARALVAQESGELVDQAPPSFVSQAVECQLTLVARDASMGLQGNTKRSEVNARGEVVTAKPPSQSAVDPIDQREHSSVDADLAPRSKVVNPSTSLEYADSRNSALAIENEESHQGQDLPTQQGLFWPFNRQDLTVDFSVSLKGDGARFHSFLIRAPVGHVRGRLANRD